MLAYGVATTFSMAKRNNSVNPAVPTADPDYQGVTKTIPTGI